MTKWIAKYRITPGITNPAKEEVVREKEEKPPAILFYRYRYVVKFCKKGRYEYLS
jgi:hypothetical protein